MEEFWLKIIRLLVDMGTEEPNDVEAFLITLLFSLMDLGLSKGGRIQQR